MVIQCGGCFQHPIKPKWISSTPNWLEAQIIGTSHWPCGFSGARVCTRAKPARNGNQRWLTTNWIKIIKYKLKHQLCQPALPLPSSFKPVLVHEFHLPANLAALKDWLCSSCRNADTVMILLNSDFVFEQIVKIYYWMILDTSGYMAIHSNTMTRRTRIDLLGPCWIMISVDAKALWADGPAAASSTARCKTYSIIRRHRTLRSAVHLKIAGI